MIFNIFTANHGKLSGIEDFVSILECVIQKRGYQVVVSEELNPNAINIIIDEFTNAYTNRMIAEFKSTYPQAILIFMLTEFLEKKWLVRSFNFFGSVLDASVIALLNVYIRLNRNDFNKPKSVDWMLATLYLPVFLLFCVLNFRKKMPVRSKQGNLKKYKRINFIGVVHHIAYMLMRYIGLEEMLGYADGVVLSHGSIDTRLVKNPLLGMVYPELDYSDIEKKLFNNKKLGVEVTGSVTPYRYKVIGDFNSNIKKQGLKSYFEECQIIAFSNTKSIDSRSAFSIHPPQTKQWKYSSPTRIYRALQFDHNMPILTKVFNQHPIEKLCLILSDSTLLEMISFYKNTNKAWSFLAPKINEYNQVAKSGNDEMINAIIDLAKQRSGR